MVIGFGLFKLQKNPIQGQPSDINLMTTETIGDSQNVNNTNQISTYHESLKKETSTSLYLESDLNTSANNNTKLLKESFTENQSSSNNEYQQNLNLTSTNTNLNSSSSSSSSSKQNQDIDQHSIGLNKTLEGNTSSTKSALASQALETFISESSSTSSLSNALKLLSINSLNKIVPELEPLNNYPLFKLKPQDCPTFRAKRWFLALVPEVSYDINIKTLSTTSPEFIDLVNERNAGESTLEGYSLGLSGMMYHKKGMYFKLGLRYSAFTERMDFSRTYTEMDTTQGIISITESESGDTLTIIYGDIIINREVMETTRAHYRFSMIDIPFSAGMSFNSNSFGIDVEAGLLFNIRTTTSGKVLANDLSFTDLGNQPLFKTSLGLGYFGAIYLRKDIHPRGSIIFGPKYRVRPQHFNTDLNPIKQQYTTLEFHLGYIHRF